LQLGGTKDTGTHPAHARRLRSTLRRLGDSRPNLGGARHNILIIPASIRSGGRDVRRQDRRGHRRGRVRGRGDVGRQDVRVRFGRYAEDLVEVDVGAFRVDLREEQKREEAVVRGQVFDEDILWSSPEGCSCRARYRLGRKCRRAPNRYFETKFTNKTRQSKTKQPHQHPTFPLALSLEQNYDSLSLDDHMNLATIHPPLSQTDLLADHQVRTGRVHIGVGQCELESRGSVLLGDAVAGVSGDYGCVTGAVGDSCLGLGYGVVKSIFGKVSSRKANMPGGDWSAYPSDPNRERR
jgi:hypothetical protein